MADLILFLVCVVAFAAIVVICAWSLLEPRSEDPDGER